VVWFLYRFFNFSMKTLRWTFLLALQSNRSAEFFILHSPALIPKFPQSPSSSYLFSHAPKTTSSVNIDSHAKYMSQSPSGSYLFSHWSSKSDWEVWISLSVSIALKLLPVFTQLLFLMQKTCAFLNPKILTSLFNPIWVDQWNLLISIFQSLYRYLQPILTSSILRPA